MNNGSDLDGIVTVEEEVVGTDDTADRVEVSLPHTRCCRHKAEQRYAAQ